MKRSLVIETPWLRGEAGWEFARRLPDLLERGVRVRVFYGYSCADDRNDPELVQHLSLLLKEDLVRVRFGTHEKVLVADGGFAVVGSWNWLSNGHATRRRELSVMIRGEAAARIAEEYRRTTWN